MEIKRIKVLHPGWEPPTDLFDEARDPAADKKLWELYAANRFDDILTFVQDIRAADPTWRPSPEFVKKFETASTRADIIAASDAKDATAVLRLAEENPDMLVCGDVDVLWRVAEALVATNEADKAKDLYGFILNQCTNTAERVATLQKAMQLLPLTTVQGLMAATGRRGLGDKEMESVRLDLLRRQIGTAISDPTSVPPEAKTFEALVIQRKLSTDAVLLGWYRYAQKDWKAAEVWFKQAMDWERMPKAAEGYALTLRQQGLLAEAEAVAFAWRDADPLIAKLYVEIVATELTRPNPRSVEERRLAQMEEVVAKSSSALGAQAMGWYFYNTKSFPRSSQWFAKSVEWEPTETSALGLALAAAHAKDQALFRKTVAQYGAAYPTVAALEFAAAAECRERQPAARCRPRFVGGRWRWRRRRRRDRGVGEASRRPVQERQLPRGFGDPRQARRKGPRGSGSRCAAGLGALPLEPVRQGPRSICRDGQERLDPRHPVRSLLLGRATRSDASRRLAAWPGRAGDSTRAGAGGAVCRSDEPLWRPIGSTNLSGDECNERFSEYAG